MTTTVFLADDHTIVRDGLQHLIDAQPDLQVVGVAGDGLAAARMVEQLCPDVAILDISMPILNGIEAAQEIRRRCPCVQIIMLTILYAPEHIVGALQAGARGYLLKESAGSDLIDAIHVVCAGERYLSSGISAIALDQFVNPSQPQAERDLLETLTARERQVTQMVTGGHTTQSISVSLSLSPKTVKSYRSRVMRKLDVKHLPGLVKFAIRHGLTSLE